MVVSSKLKWATGLLLAVILTSPSAVCTAQDNQATGNQSKSEKSAIASKTGEKEAPDIDYMLENYRLDFETEKTITLAEVIVQIRRRFPDFNIIGDSRVSEINISPMSLKNINLGSLFNALLAAADNTFYFEQESEYFAFISAIRKVVPAKILVLNIEDLLLDYKVEDFLSAVDVGLEMNGRSRSDLKISLHAQTNLLFVKAQQQDMDLVLQVIEQLGGEQIPRRAPAQPNQNANPANKPEAVPAKPRRTGGGGGVF